MILTGLTVKCVRCGKSIPHTLPDADSGASYLDWLFACGDCKRVLGSIIGTPNSPGRPPMSASQARVARYRAMGKAMKSRRTAQPTPPRMPSSHSERPSSAGPSAPRPNGIFG